MSIDTLNANISQLSTDIQALIAQGVNSVPQSQVDAAAANVAALDATVKAALVPAPAPTPTPTPAS